MRDQQSLPEQSMLAGRPDKGDLLVVGIGASAGGVQALRTFFENVPANPGMAYVVILHLSPDYDSQLTEVLQQVTSLKVKQVKESTPVQVNHVYVVPPNQHLLMTEGHIVVAENAGLEERRAPVDIFFRTMATALGPRAVCVILSGTGANGSMGLRRVKEGGGAVFVQNPREAEFNEMPRNAIATELVDDVLPVAEIPGKIIAYKLNLGSVEIPLDRENRAEEQQHALREVFTHLRLRTGHDFSNYKRPTLLRRIERRVNVRNLHGLKEYAAYLQHNPDEVTSLLKDLLISVTNFFRDKKAFEVVEQEVVPTILAAKKAEDQVRIWIAGCATGEEAYSLAILFAEKTLGIIDAPKIQIFATDIDDAAIAIAREGLYTINDAADMSVERLRRFFNKEGDGYRIRREIREMILFANHNILKDPPFSHLDLVSCRNVLIYLNHTAQERVMETFHFSLKPGGYLFLGLSESAESTTDLYITSNREFHIFRSRQIKYSSYPVPDSIPNLKFPEPIHFPPVIPQESRSRERVAMNDLHQRLLEEYAPPSLVINEEFDILHMSERAVKYLQMTGGELSQNLLKLVRQEIRLELRSALYQAIQRQTSVEARGLSVNINGQVETLNIHIRPVFRQGDAANGLMLVIFERGANEMPEQEVIVSSDEPVARQLEDELIRLKAQLRASVEQHEFQQEELKASNEELQAMNEELRSAAEELETSKEELQSINEELRTVNQELKVKVEETTIASNNLQNLINSAEIGTIFLDRSFRVVLFTPPARTVFNLIPNDIGRPLSDITNKLTDPNIISDAEIVLDKLQTIEREVVSVDGRIFLMRLLPYRTEEDRINGVVITFVDMTQHKQAETVLRENEVWINGQKEAFQAAMNGQSLASSLAPLIRTIVTQTKGEARAAFYRISPDKKSLHHIVGMSEEYAKDVDGFKVGADSTACGFAMHTGEPVITTDVEKEERWIPFIALARNHGYRACWSFPLKTLGGPVVGTLAIYFTYPREPLPRELELTGVITHAAAIIISRHTELTERAQAEAALRQSEERYKAIVRQATAGICRTLLDGKLTFVNKILCEMLGYTEEELIGKTIWHFAHPDDLDEYREMFKKLESTAEPFGIEKRLIRHDGKVIWANISMAPIRDINGKSESTAAVIIDITERKQAEKALQNSEQQLKVLLRQKDDFIGVASHELKTPVTSMKVYAEIVQEKLTESGNVEDAELLNRLNTQIDRLTHLINDLLDTTKISEGKMSFSFAPTNINDIVRERVEEMSRITNHHLDLQMEDLPLINADQERIGQVVVNLLSNAIKYSPDTSSIKIRTERVGNEIKVSVQDEGLGISKEEQQKIFDRFYRVMSRNLDTYPGVGLGLYISAQIISRHQGTIAVQSEEGQGATFSFVLPVNGLG
ncbi:CheR family methyltransferase [Chitinophaga sp.]|uniref:CheR family methyltransferase n=1 Tax=Chitinophaga sp. TaxID=1869181 RepID=UPI0031DFA11F